MRASALVCLGAGAGIIAGELRHVRGTDVVDRAGGVLVLIGGRRARSVPVLDRYRQPLRAAASFAGGGLICGGREPGRRNITDELCHALSSDRSLPRLEPGRLRSTWLMSRALSGSGSACSCRPPGSAAANGWGIWPPSCPPPLRPN